MTEENGHPHPGAVDELRVGFQRPDPAARPMMRWWWFGPDVERADILRDLDDMAAAGIGGAEIASVYPMGGSSGRFLSDAHLSDLRFAAEAAAERGLRLDLTLGSGWPYGGPHIDETTASRKISWICEELPMEEQLLPGPRAWPHDELLAAYVAEGTPHERPEGFTRLKVDSGGIHVPQGKGPRTVLIALSRLTGQSLKRASAGAEGLALDHYSAAATWRHIEAVAEPMIQAVGAELLGTVFCDSLEVYDADWTPHLAEAFQRHRGYDALEHLWKLRTSAEEHAAFRADYYSTLTELLEQNFIRVMGEWARSKGLSFRVQSYGEPPARVSSYRDADAFEGEHWGWDLVTACRWASSAAQIYGRQVVSSECWTWTHAPSFRSTPLDLLGEAQEHLLMGINQFIGHGWPASPRPKDGAQLGRIFYASGALDSRNEWWEVAPSLWGTIHRLCWLMRQGERLSEIGVYIPARDLASRFRSGGRIDLYREARLHIGQELPRAIRQAGLDFDLFDDEAVHHLDPDRFPVIVLPHSRDIPESTRQWLQEVERAGGLVFDLGSTAGIGRSAQGPQELVGSVRGTVHLRQSGASSSAGSAPAGGALAVTTRKVGEVLIHLVVNTSNQPQEGTLEFSSQASCLERWDAESGRVLEVEHDLRERPLRLEAYESAVFVRHQGPTPERPAIPGAPASDGEELKEWSAVWAAEEPKPVTLPHRWPEAPGGQAPTGQVRYTTEITVPDGASRVLLDFGEAEQGEARDPEPGRFGNSYRAGVRTPVEAAAVVLVDGEPVGTVWKPPYRVDLSDVVRSGGRHQLTVAVAGVTSPKLARDPGLLAMVAQAEESYGRRFGLQNLELASEGVSPGVHTVPRLRIS